MGLILGPAQWVKGSGIAAVVAQVEAVARIQSLAQELPYAVGAQSPLPKKLKTRSINRPHF